MCVAFLRGINVAHRRVKNAQLCASFEDIGFGRVSGFLASGNILFEPDCPPAANLESMIEQRLEETLGFLVPTFVRTQAEVVKVAGTRPFSSDVREASAGKLQVVFLSTRPSNSNGKAVMTRSSADDHLAFRDRELYWLPERGVSRSKLDWNSIGKILGGFTVRSHSTVERLSVKIAT